ncbi:uncharacterized protein LOC111365110 [Spodoptera litura]|uniref:Uncharacterized protein LOC111365110 n=1 Tax=Spodoptera litura TaxID=69820 RepID=A0A9J7EXZ1_SPOLT|nr:uncharacterized protein LOC111365110 [Spodoptera litura]
MLSYNLQILGLSEVRRNGFGELRTPGGLTLLYSGKESEEDLREHGVGLLLSNAAKKSLMDWKPISDRIVYARFTSRARNISIVQCYAPTNAAQEDIKDDFYNALNATMKTIRKQDIVLVMGDLNAKVGRDNTNRTRHMGTQGLGVCNENGERFIEFCQNHDLTIGGTLFIHGDHHKYTWTSPDGVTRNQIDHIAISSKWRSSLLDVRNRRGADIDSDHHLVVAEIRLKIAVAHAYRGPGRVGRRFEVSKLHDPGTRKSFQLELRNRFATLEAAVDSLDEEWNRIKVAYTETSSNVLGHKTTHSREDWMSQRTWDLIEDRRKLHLKLLETHNDTVRADLNTQYRQKRKEIYRSTRRDRRQWADGYFLWRGEYYLQVNGVAMGSPLAPVVANIYMEWFEGQALASAPVRPRHWWRYVDDVFAIVNREHVAEFVGHLNSVHGSIQFTTEEEREGMLPFLDVLMTEPGKTVSEKKINDDPPIFNNFPHSSKNS